GRRTRGGDGLGVPGRRADPALGGAAGRVPGARLALPAAPSRSPAPGTAADVDAGTAPHGPRLGRRERTHGGRGAAAGRAPRARADPRLARAPGRARAAERSPRGL